MEHRIHRTPRTILSLPNNGRTSTWTGRTTSGQTIHSVVALPNRTVQLHFHCDDVIPPYTKSIENSHFERLANFWFEYPMRHFGVAPDDLDSDQPDQDLPDGLPNIAPLFNMRAVQNGGARLPIRPRQLFPPTQNVSYLRLSHAPTIGREMVYGCPYIGNDLAMSSLQAKSVLYTHHRSGTVDVLIIKIFIAPADEDFDNDHTNFYIRNQTFPNFNFHQPVLARDHFRMGNSSFISRNGSVLMFEHVLYFNIHDKRMPKVSKCAFHIKLDNVLTNEIAIDPRPLFTHKSTSPTFEKLMLKMGRKGLLNKSPTRITSNDSAELFELVRDDPCFKEIADSLSLQRFYELQALIRTSYCEPQFNLFLTLYA